MINSVQLEGLTYVKMLKEKSNKTENSTEFEDVLDKVSKEQTEEVSASESKYTNPDDLVVVDSPASLECYFEEAADTYGVPIALIKAVAKAESNFNANAVSSAGAQGVMQLMPATAKGLGVEDSFDARQNIMGGTKLLAQNLTKYNGSVKLALAAYNAGAGNVAKYDGVPPFTETQNYIKKIFGYLGVNQNNTSDKPTTDNNNVEKVNETTTDKNSSIVQNTQTDIDELAEAILKKITQSNSTSLVNSVTNSGNVDYSSLISSLYGNSTFSSILSNSLK